MDVLSSRSVGELQDGVTTSEVNHASSSNSPEGVNEHSYPSPQAAIEGASTTRLVPPGESTPTWRMTTSIRKPRFTDTEKKGLVARDDQRVPVAMIANEVNPRASLVSFRAAKEALDGDDFRRKCVVLRRLQDQLVTRDGSLEEQDTRHLLQFTESMAAVCRALKLPGLGSFRMVELVCSIASTLACLTGPGFTVPASIIIPELLQFLSIPETGVRKSVSQSVETILEECPTTSTLHAATASLVDAKNPNLRQDGSRFLYFTLRKLPEEALRVSRPLIMGQIRKAMVDSDANVRWEGRGAFGAFVRLWPAEGVRMYNALDCASQRVTLQEQPFLSNFIDGVTSDSPPSSCEEGNQREKVLISKTWRPSPSGRVGSLPAGSCMTDLGGGRRSFSPLKGTARSASRLPLRSSLEGSHEAEQIGDSLTGTARATSSLTNSLSSEESGLMTDHNEEGGCGMTTGKLCRSMMGKYDEFPCPSLHDQQRNANKTKLSPRCVGAHRALGLPPGGLVHTPSPRTSSSKHSETTTSFTPNCSARSGVVPPGGASPQRNGNKASSLPRCVDPRHALGLPSGGSVHTPSPRTSGGEPSEATTSFTSNRSSLSGVVPPGGASPQLNGNKPSSLPRCVDPRRALGLPSGGLVHTSPPRTFNGEHSEVTTSFTPNSSARSGVVPPRGASSQRNGNKPSSLPRCVNAHHALGLPSGGSVHPPSPRTFNGKPSEATSFTSNCSARSGVVPPRGASPQRNGNKPSSLPRCVDPRRALGLPSGGSLHPPSPRTSSGEPSEVTTSFTPNCSALSGMVPPGGVSPQRNGNKPSSLPRCVDPRRALGLPSGGSEVTTSFTLNCSARSGVIPQRGANPQLSGNKSSSLPRCVDPRRALGLPSGGSVHTLSPRTFNGEHLEATSSFTPNCSALSGVVSPRGASPQLNGNKPSSLPRCVDPRRALGLPSGGSVHTPLSRTSSGEPSEVTTSFTPNCSALSGMVPPGGVSPQRNGNKSSSLPRCVDPRRALGLPSGGSVHTLSPRTFNGVHSEATTSFTPNCSALSGVVPPRGASPQLTGEKPSSLPRCVDPRRALGLPSGGSVLTPSPQTSSGEASEATISFTPNCSALSGVVPPGGVSPQRNRNKPSSLLRCVDPRRASGLPSGGSGHTPSPRTFNGVHSEATTRFPSNRSSLSGVVPSRGTSRPATRRVRFSPYKEEISLVERSLTVRATAEEDIVTTAKVDERQHGKKMPRIILALLVTFTIIVAYEVFGFILSMGKPSGGGNPAHPEAAVVAGTTGVLYQQELEASVRSLRACAAVDLGIVTTKGNSDGTSTSGIGREWDSEFSRELATGSTPDKASAAVEAVHDVPLTCVCGEVETWNDTISAVSGRVDAGESMPHAASEHWFIVSVAMVSAIASALLNALVMKCLADADNRPGLAIR